MYKNIIIFTILPLLIISVKLNISEILFKEKIVKTITINELEDRYTIPAKKYTSSYWHPGAMMHFKKTWWESSKDIHYETWRIESYDKYYITLQKVDPLNPPDISEGSRYRGYWN